MSPRTRALISVSDKTGVLALAKSLIDMDIEIVSTGGTAATLRDAGLTVTDVSEVTGFPELMDGRVKTLHPKIHGGLLARRDRDAAAMAEHGISPIDLLVVNLYPFEATIARVDCAREEALENIDIGGPAMLRAAAKNHEFVTVVVDPNDYDGIVAELRDHAKTVSARTRRRLATKAFAHTAGYDAAIWTYLRGQQETDELPESLPLPLRKLSDLRYGENPHQRAALYGLPNPPSGSVVHARQHQGKPLSYNNIADADAALECVTAMQKVACVIVKHANPCGVGVAASALEAYEKAYRTDPTSAFGGVIALNVECDPVLAETIVERQFVEVIGSCLRLQQVNGGILVQDNDIVRLDESALKVVTDRKPTDEELADAQLAWDVARFVKSNAIVYCRDGATIGVGAGQMSRVMSAKIAAWKAEEASLPVEGAAMASDAFFPFRDGIDIAARYGIRVVIQPGGSMRDQEVIEAANEHGMAMLFTGTRHFRH
jgi:phosphoribosylaminoimidazolecarboxamide formyltransferase/IMP cyclohydrolase